MCMCILQKKFTVSRQRWSNQEGMYCSRACYFGHRQAKKVPQYQDRLHRNVRRAITRNIKEKKNYKQWEAILGYSTIELVNHLERLFKTGMTWNNYGKWHVDHIIPVSAFRFSKYEDLEFKQCWKIENLQPLWAIENIKKGGVKK